jgi:hypothetical protein
VKGATFVDKLPVCRSVTQNKAKERKGKQRTGKKRKEQETKRTSTPRILPAAFVQCRGADVSTRCATSAKPSASNIDRWFATLPIKVMRKKERKEM